MRLQEKIARLGTDRSHGLLHHADEVRVDEKIDGSQITFGVFDGQLRIRSKSRDLDIENPDGMFLEAVQEIRAVRDRLLPGYTYHGEYLQRPRHNVLCYERVPKNHVVIFDIWSPVTQCSAHPGSLADNCEAIGAFEPVQYRYMRPADVTSSVFESSQLGGVPEGVVVKGPGGVTAKLVSEQFKEVKDDHTARTRLNPDRDLATTLANRFCPPARYLKAVQRLKENGQHTASMSDIGPLRKEISIDLEGECVAEIKEQLYQAFRKQVLRAALDPLAEWYRQYLTNDNAFWSEQRGKVR